MLAVALLLETADAPPVLYPVAYPVADLLGEDATADDLNTIAAVVKEAVPAEQWREAGGPCRVVTRFETRTLVIRAPQRDHEAIVARLTEVRRETALPQVTVGGALYEVPDAAAVAAVWAEAGREEAAPVPGVPATLPDAGSLAAVTAALGRRAGCVLLGHPQVTALGGHAATITVEADAAAPLSVAALPVVPAADAADTTGVEQSGGASLAVAAAFAVPDALPEPVTEAATPLPPGGTRAVLAADGNGRVALVLLSVTDVRPRAR